LNELEGISGIVANYYSPLGEDNRKYFTIENAQLIDNARIYLEDKKNELDNNDYYFILASILISSDKIANIPSVYGSYLKEFKKSSLKKFKVIPIHKREIQQNENETYNLECLDCIDEISSIDIAYLDPPYNQRQYGKNYHVLNYIAKYNSNLEIYGKTGLIKNTIHSDWCKKKEAPIILEKILDKLKNKTKYVLLSYNNEGTIEFDKIRELMEEKCEEVILVETVA